MGVMALTFDEGTLGLRRVVVPTAVGDVVVRTGRRSGETATILLHGAAGSWTTWTPLIEASDAGSSPLADVIAVDLPGWGESPDAAAPPRENLPGQYADVSVTGLAQATAQIARHLGYERWRIIGHSLGGLIALDLAALEPAATSSVTLVSGTGRGVLDAIRRPVRGGLRLPWFAGMLLIMRALSPVDAGARRLVRVLHSAHLLATLSAPLFDDRRPVDQSAVEALSAEVRPRSFARAARAAKVYNESVWRDIRCPVRSIRGERDAFVRADDGAGFASLIHDFAEVTVSNAGHFAALEHPDAVLDVLAHLEVTRRGHPARTADTLGA